MNSNGLFSQIKNNNIFNVYIFEGEKRELKSKCIEFARNIYPGIHEVQNLIEVISAEKNSISIDKIREFNKAVYERPSELDYRIFVIEDAHLLRVEAQNALLKTLEDMPEYAILILATHNRFALLDTIISRAQVYKFSSEKVLDFNLQSSKNTINLLQKILEKKHYIINKEKELIKELSEDKEDSLYFLSEFFAGNQLGNSKYSELKRLYSHISTKSREKIILAIEEIKNYLKVNINFQLAMENLIFIIIEELNKGINEKK